MTQVTKKITVVGNGWSALAAIAWELQRGSKVIWITGAGGQIRCPLASFQSESGAAAWGRLAQFAGLDVGAVSLAVFEREFRGKGFHLASAPELWGPERWFVSEREARFELSAAEIELALREKLTAMALEGKSVELITGVQIDEIRVGDPPAVRLASGSWIDCDQVIYADSWTSLSTLKGMPKNHLSLNDIHRKWQPCGVIQVEFDHNAPVGALTSENFFVRAHKDTGELIERHIWGHFYAAGKKSLWTMFLGAEEVEDNAVVARKFRKIKQALDKMFVGSEWLPNGKKSFLETISREHIRFEENVLFGAAESFQGIPADYCVELLTDGFGPTHAVEQVARFCQNKLTSAPLKTSNVVLNEGTGRPGPWGVF